MDYLTLRFYTRSMADLTLGNSQKPIVEEADLQNVSQKNL